jgi:hypothetical protein
VGPLSTPISIAYIYGEKMTNPLSQYFRQPSIHIKLPSGGQFYPAGAVDIPPNGELPVYPMTAIDEITYRTPDALFNGSAVVSVIQSCVPSIKNAWEVPSTDVDALLTAIRIASFGHDMPVDCYCPKCNNEDNFAVDLRTVLDNLKSDDYVTPIKHRDLEIFFKPMNYRTLNANNQVQFEEQKTIQNLAMSESTTDEDRASKIGEVLKKITEMTVSSIAQSISAIKTPTGLVNEPEYIADFLKNCESQLFTQIRDRVIKLKSTSEIQPIGVACSACNHEYQQQFTLDMTSFFDRAS